MPSLDPISNTIENEVHRLVFDVGLKSATAALLAQFWFLDIPGVKQVFLFLVNRVAEAIYAPLARFVKFQVIDSQVRGQLHGYEEALLKFKESTPQEREAARAELERRLSDLVRLK